MTNNNPFSTALAKHRVTAVVKDLDYKRTGVAVETEYIIQVEPKPQPSSVTADESATNNNSRQSEVLFEPFRLSKTYSAFRSLASQLQNIAKGAAEQQQQQQGRAGDDDWDSLHLSVQQAIQFTESVVLQVNKQHREYLGKVRFSMVKSTSQQRKHIITDVLASLLANFPTSGGTNEHNNDDKADSSDSRATNVAKEMAAVIEFFFLTDHVHEEEEEEEADQQKETKNSDMNNLRLSDLSAAAQKVVSQAGKVMAIHTVIPVSSKPRASLMVRQQHAMELEEHYDRETEGLILGDNESEEHDNHRTGGTRKANPSTSKINLTMDLLVPILKSDVTFLVIILFAVLVPRGSISAWHPTPVTMDSDIFLLLVGVVYFLGLHTPRTPPPTPVGETSSASLSSAGVLLRKSMATSSRAAIETQASLPPVMKSPMDVFPEDAPLGSKFNCWSQPFSSNFMVRGPQYFSDRIKCPSKDFVFPCRGVDLFLTDMCPENVGRIGGIMGGRLRDVPSLIVNYRLPWGVLLFYYEIPERFIPCLHKRYDPEFDDTALPSLNEMSPADRTVSRFLLGDDTYRDQRFKIVPVVVQGPWIAKSVVGGKPAILGKKVPTSWIYQPREGDKAMYLEADLDIVSSSAARGILSVLRSCTSTLTIDLGYTIEAQEEDELPECMLIGTRIHGIEPTSAAALPPMKDFYLES